MIHTKKLTIILSIALFVLVVALLLLIQKSGDAEQQQKAQAIIQEFKQPIISSVVLFDGFDDSGKIKLNEDYKFKRGNNVFVSVEVGQITNPTTPEGKFVYGIQEFAQVTDENGNAATPFNGLVVDMDNYLKNKNDPVMINNQFEIPQDIKPGQYTLQITIYDKISKIETKTEKIIFEII